MILTENTKAGADNVAFTTADILNLVKRYRWLLISLPTASVVLALTLFPLIRPIWEASALIQVGQIWQSTLTSKAERLIEPPGQSAARIMNPSFGYEVFRHIGINVDNDSPQLRLLRKSLKAKPVKDAADLIEVRLRAYSEAEAKRLIEAVVEVVRAAHAKILDSHTLFTNNHIHVVERDIEQITQYLNQIETHLQAERSRLDRIEKEKPSNLGPNETILYSMLFEGISKEIAALTQQKFQVEANLLLNKTRILDLNEQINPSRTFPTRLASEIYADDKPVFPRKGWVVSMSVLAGLLLAFLIAWAHSMLGAAGNRAPESARP